MTNKRYRRDDEGNDIDEKRKKWAGGAQFTRLLLQVQVLNYHAQEILVATYRMIVPLGYTRTVFVILHS
jgi:hypothetical protein